MRQRRYWLLFQFFFSFIFIWSAPAGAGDQLLLNPGFESAIPGEHWGFDPGDPTHHIRTEDSGFGWSVSPQSGAYMWRGGDHNLVGLYQTINLGRLGYDDFRLDTCGSWVEYGGWDRSGGADRILISLGQYDSAHNSTRFSNLGWHSDKGWNHRTGQVRLDAGTRVLSFRIDGDRRYGKRNNIYFDRGHLIIHEYDVWTHGDTSSARAGTGDWTVDSSLTIGDHGYGAMGITNGATVFSNSHGIIGEEKGSSGAVSVKGAGSVLNTNGIWVGGSGTGTLNIESGAAVLSTDDYGKIGFNKDASGTVNVRGTDSVWNITYDLYVGHYGTGLLNIENGASVSDRYGVIGNFTGASGAVNVKGEGSAWTSSLDLYVGDSGTGILNIEGGAAVSNNREAYIGLRLGSSGTVNVRDTESVWKITDNLYVGYLGTGTLNIENSGRVEAKGGLTLSGTGVINLNGGKLRVNGIKDQGGALNLDWGKLTLSGHNDLGTVSAGNTTIELAKDARLNTGNFSTSGNLELKGNNTLTGRQLVLTGGRIIGSGQIHAGLDLGLNGELIGYGTGLTLWGDLSGSGKVRNTIINGNISLGKSLGTLEMENVDISRSALFMELGGTGAPGLDYDQIIFSGDIDLTGALLNLALFNDFMPRADDIFTLFDFTDARLKGMFASLSLPKLSKGLVWDTGNLYSQGTLGVSSVPLPGAFGLLFSGLAGFAAFARRPKGRPQGKALQD